MDAQGAPFIPKEWVGGKQRSIHKPTDCNPWAFSMESGLDGSLGGERMGESEWRIGEGKGQEPLLQVEYREGVAAFPISTRLNGGRSVRRSPGVFRYKPLP